MGKRRRRSDSITDTPTLYYRYVGRMYRIRLFSDAVEVVRLKTGTSPAAKPLSFRRVSGLHDDLGWRRSVLEALLDRYEQRLADEKD